VLKYAGEGHFVTKARLARPFLQDVLRACSLLVEALAYCLSLPVGGSFSLRTQTAEGPVFLKTATDKLVFRGVMWACAVSGLFIAYGLARMATGTGKIQRF